MYNNNCNHCILNNFNADSNQNVNFNTQLHGFCSCYTVHIGQIKCHSSAKILEHIRHMTMEN